MKLLKVLGTSVIASCIIVTSAHSMGRGDDPEFNELVVFATDTNGDGKISKAEFKSMHDKMAAAEFAGWDTNNDGVITLDELNSGQKNR